MGKKRFEPGALRPKAGDAVNSAARGRLDVHNDSDLKFKFAQLKG